MSGRFSAREWPISASTQVSTLGEAHRLGWRAKAHCLQFGPMAKSGHWPQDTFARRSRNSTCRHSFGREAPPSRSTSWRAG
jgi:hypothetical protein